MIPISSKGSSLFRTSRFAILLGVLLASGSLTVGLSLDDLVQRSILLQKVTLFENTDLFNFGPGDATFTTPIIKRGPYPWFTLPEIKMRFFRPLAVATTFFDVLALNDNSILAHAHSMLWLFALLVIAAKLYARLNAAIAFYALLLFAIDDAHTLPTVWLANRNSLMALTFALLALLFHLKWREGYKPVFRLTAVVSVCLALLSAEAAMGSLVYLFFYELVYRKDSIRNRVFALWPYAALVVVYLAYYQTHNYGTFGSATYVDPMREPLVYLKQVPQRLLAMMGSFISGVGSDLWLTAPQFKVVLFALGVLCALVAPKLYSLAKCENEEAQRILNWLLLSSIVALLPFLSTFPSERLFLAPSFGLCFFVAQILKNAFVHRRKWVVAWVIFAFVISPLPGWVTTPITLRAWRDAVNRSVAAPKGIEKLEGRVVILTSSDLGPAIYGTFAMLLQNLKLPYSWHILSMAPSPHIFERTAIDTFELEPVNATFLSSVFEQNLRAERFVIHQGDTFELDKLTVTVVSTENDKPKRIRVKLSLPEAQYTFVVFNGSTYEAVHLPPVGEKMLMARAPTSVERAFFGSAALESNEIFRRIENSPSAQLTR